MTCSFRTHRECSCGPSECRVSRPFGNHHASFNEAHAKATRALHVAAVCVAFCIVMAGVLLAAESGIARQDVAMQEASVTWAR